MAKGELKNNEPTLFDQPPKVEVNIPLVNKIENYYYVILPDLTKKENAVLNTMEMIGKPCTQQEVADRMMVPLHTISGRFGENGLKGKGKIKIIGKKNNKSVYEVIKNVASKTN